MPLLITDPRYVLLPSQNDRENVFNEWCRDIARANRLAKGQAALHPSVTEGVEGEGDGTATTESQHVLSKEEEKQRARETYDALLKEDVKSTRTTWDEFRRKWKKDRRFFGFGRDEREREKVFKAWLKDLGERELYYYYFFGRSLICDLKYRKTRPGSKGGNGIHGDVEKQRSNFAHHTRVTMERCTSLTFTRYSGKTRLTVVARNVGQAIARERPTI